MAGRLQGRGIGGGVPIVNEESGEFGNVGVGVGGGAPSIF